MDSRIASWWTISNRGRGMSMWSARGIVSAIKSRLIATRCIPARNFFPCSRCSPPRRRTCSDGRSSQDRLITDDYCKVIKPEDVPHKNKTVFSHTCHLHISKWRLRRSASFPCPNSIPDHPLRIHPREQELRPPYLRLHRPLRPL